MAVLLEELNVESGNRAVMKEEFATAYSAVREAYNNVYACSEAYHDTVDDNRAKLEELQQEQAETAELLKSVTTTAEGKTLLAKKADIEQDIELHETVISGVESSLQQDIANSVADFYAVIDSADKVWTAFRKEIVTTASVRTIKTDAEIINRYGDGLGSLKQSVKILLLDANVILHRDNHLVVGENRIYIDGSSHYIPSPERDVLKELSRNEYALR